jgi:hypothetical protein
VVLDGAGVRRETRTDDGGRFRFAGLRQGNYEVYLVLPDTLAPYRQSPADPHYPRTESRIRSSVTIDGSRDCAAVSFTVQSSGRISGFASAEDGKPLTGIVVQGALVKDLLRVEETRAKGAFAFLYSAKAVTDERGYFEFLNLPAGRYVVGVTLEHDSNEDQPHPRIFHPGVTALDEAAIVDLKLGERVDIGAFKLPARLARITINGTVVRPDGRPAGNVSIMVTNNWKARLRPTSTDDEGRFSLFVYPGYSYALSVTASFGKEAFVGEASFSLESPGAAPAPIRIELRPKGTVALGKAWGRRLGTAAVDRAVVSVRPSPV